MVPRNLLSSLAGFLFVALVAGGAVFAACEAVGSCGGNGSNCPIGEMCESVSGRGTQCVPRAQCGSTATCTGSGCGPSNGCSQTQMCILGRCFNSSSCGQNGAACSAIGCGTGCPTGQICAIGGGGQVGGFVCVADDNNDCAAGNTCTRLGCGPGNGCTPNQICVNSGGGQTGNRMICATDSFNTCTTQQCSDADGGCESGGCGPGYRCSNHVCTVDSTCIRGTLDVPYTGPKIYSFSTIMGRVYNLLFPAAILLGSIIMIKAGYGLMTSEGDPRKTKEGQEDLTAAIVGTAFIVLSAAILRIIIVQILGGSVSF